MSKVGRYFHTIRYLKPVQVIGRIKFNLQRPSLSVAAAPDRRERKGPYAVPIAMPPSLVSRDTFRFLNVEHRSTGSDGWRPSGASKLWIYNLHYFDDLNAAAADSRRAWHEALLQRWIAENPPGAGDGWEPYPLSRRIVNWIKWICRGHEAQVACHASLAMQARWLEQRLEKHILGNHLFTNAKALVHAGLYFDGAEADRWYATGCAIIERELERQVLADGGHFELSPMYHSAAVEDLLDLINLSRACQREPPHSWCSVIPGMCRWLELMSHPDGEIAFFNDAAFAIAPTSVQIADYAARLGWPRTPLQENEDLVSLTTSGYVRAVAGDACLLCDCAAIGPDYLPAHAHADTLSFELSLGVERILVNSGTGEYGTSEERQRQRGTTAHNTVVINGQDSSEVWAGFRVARRARAKLHATEHRDGHSVIEASHDGYRRLAGRNTHSRRWELTGQQLLVHDRVSGAFTSAAAYFHLHPQVTATQSAPGAVTLGSRSFSVEMLFTGAARVEIRPSTWHPRFGEAIKNLCVVVHLAGERLSSTLCWKKTQ